MIQVELDDLFEEKLNTLDTRFTKSVSRLQGNQFDSEFAVAYKTTQQEFQNQNYDSALNGLKEIQKYFFTNTLETGKPTQNIGNSITIFTELRDILISLNDNQKFEEEMTQIEETFQTYQTICPEEEIEVIEDIINNLHEAYGNNNLPEIRKTLVPLLKREYVDKALGVMDISFAVNESYQVIQEITKRQLYRHNHRPKAAIKNESLVQYR